MAQEPDDRSHLEGLDSTSPSEGSIGYGPPGMYEDWLVGDRRSFEKLRSDIDELLANGNDVHCDDQSCPDFAGLSLGERETKLEDTKMEWIWMLGCLGAALVGTTLLVLGAWKIFEILSGE